MLCSPVVCGCPVPGGPFSCSCPVSGGPSVLPIPLRLPTLHGRRYSAYLPGPAPHGRHPRQLLPPCAVPPGLLITSRQHPHEPVRLVLGVLPTALPGATRHRARANPLYPGSSLGSYRGCRAWQSAATLELKSTPARTGMTPRPTSSIPQRLPALKSSVRGSPMHQC